MRRLFLALIPLILFAVSAQSRGRIQGIAVVSQSVTTAGSNSSNKFPRVLANCTITVYAPTGTTTLATIYSDMGGTVKANSFTAGADGSYFFYVDSAPVDIRFSGVTGVTPFTISDIIVNGTATTFVGGSVNNACHVGDTFADLATGKYFGCPTTNNPAQFLDASTKINVSAITGLSGLTINIQNTPYGAKCDGSTDDTAAIVAASVAAVASGQTIYIPPSANGCKIGTATIAAPIQADGGTLLLTTGQTTTFTGPLTLPSQIFFRNAQAGQGIVSFTGNNTLASINPLWFASGAGTSASPYTGWEGALQGGRKIVFQQGWFSYSSTLVLNISGMSLIGAGVGHTVLKYTGTSDAITVGGTSVGTSTFHNEVGGFLLLGNASTRDGLVIDYNVLSNVHDIWIQDVSRNAVVTRYMITDTFDRITVASTATGSSSLTVPGMTFPAQSTAPTTGILIGDAAVGRNTTTSTFRDCLVMQTSSVGWQEDVALTNTFINCDAQANTGVGWKITSAAGGLNTHIGLDIEANGGTGLWLQANNYVNRFINTVNTNSTIIDGGALVTLEGGVYAAITIANSTLVILDNIQYDANGVGATITDNCLLTQWRGFIRKFDGTAYLSHPDYKGTATFASAATVVVVFPFARPNTTYKVGLGPQANETFWVTAKTTTGFTINSSNAASTASVDWKASEIHPN